MLEDLGEEPHIHGKLFQILDAGRFLLHRFMKRCSQTLAVSITDIAGDGSYPKSLGFGLVFNESSPQDLPVPGTREGGVAEIVVTTCQTRKLFEER